MSGIDEYIERQFSQDKEKADGLSDATDFSPSSTPLTDAVILGHLDSGLSYLKRLNLMIPFARTMEEMMHAARAERDAAHASLREMIDMNAQAMASADTKTPPEESTL